MLAVIASSAQEVSSVDRKKSVSSARVKSAPQLLGASSAAGLASKEKVMASDVSDALRQAISAETGHSKRPLIIASFASLPTSSFSPSSRRSSIRWPRKSPNRSARRNSWFRWRRACRLRASKLASDGRACRAGNAEHPCVVGAGAAGFAGGSHATPSDLEKVGAILNSFGIGRRWKKNIWTLSRD